MYVPYTLHMYVAATHLFVVLKIVSVVFELFAICFRTKREMGEYSGMFMFLFVAIIIISSFFFLLIEMPINKVLKKIIFG